MNLLIKFMINRYQYIFWDWNGTLIDDAELCCQLVSEAITEAGKPAIDLKTFRNHYQHPISKLYESLGMGWTEEEFMQASDKWLMNYEKRRTNCQLHNGAQEILEKLRNIGLKQMILSAHKNDLLTKAITDFNLLHFFDEITGPVLGGGHGKKEIGQELLDKLATSPERVLLIGDSVHDHEVAEAIGIDCHLIGAGFDCPSKLIPTGRKYFNTLQDWQECVLT